MEEFLQGLARSLTFVFAAWLTAIFTKENLPVWVIGIASGVIGICAFYGWK